MNQPLPFLQLALDVPEVSAAFHVAHHVEEQVDWIEAGTPLILKAGLGVVKRLRAEFPGHKLVADVKIMDAGKTIASMAFDAGADIITVMAAAPTSVLRDVMGVAESDGQQVMLDLLGTRLDEPRLKEYLRCGVQYFIVHRSRSNGPEEQTFGSAANLLVEHQASFAVAGRINQATISSAVQYKPNVIIVGSAITMAKDPTAVAADIRSKLS